MVRPNMQRQGMRQPVAPQSSRMMVPMGTGGSVDPRLRSMVSQQQQQPQMMGWPQLADSRTSAWPQQQQAQQQQGGWPTQQTISLPSGIKLQQWVGQDGSVNNMFMPDNVFWQMANSGMLNAFQSQTPRQTGPAFGTGVRRPTGIGQPAVRPQQPPPRHEMPIYTMVDVTPEDDEDMGDMDAMANMMMMMFMSRMQNNTRAKPASRPPIDIEIDDEDELELDGEEELLEDEIPTPSSSTPAAKPVLPKSSPEDDALLLALLPLLQK